MKKVKAIISALLAALMFCGFAVIAHAKTTKKQTKTTTAKAVSSDVSDVKDDKEKKDDSEEEGKRLEEMTPEEIAEIGVGAQIAAGQKPDNVTIVTNTDLMPEREPVDETAAADTASLSTAVAVLIALVSVLFVAVGLILARSTSISD